MIVVHTQHAWSSSWLSNLLICSWHHRMQTQSVHDVDLDGIVPWINCAASHRRLCASVHCFLILAESFQLYIIYTSIATIWKYNAMTDTMPWLALTETGYIVCHSVWFNSQRYSIDLVSIVKIISTNVRQTDAGMHGSTTTTLLICENSILY